MWVKALFWVAMGLAALANVLVYLILRDTNANKPVSQKEGYFWWYPQKMLRIFREYEQRFPTGKKAFWFKVCFAAGSLTFFTWFYLSFWYTSL